MWTTGGSSTSPILSTARPGRRCSTAGCTSLRCTRLRRRCRWRSMAARRPSGVTRGSTSTGSCPGCTLTVSASPVMTEEAMSSSHDLCVDAYVGDEQFDPALLPRSADVLQAPAGELAMAWRRQWQSGQELRIRFLDGEAELRRRVQEHAEIWLNYANVTFRFGNYVDAEIRVSFTGLGSWSLIGTDAARADRAARTMQLGGFTAAADELELPRGAAHPGGWAAQDHAAGGVHGRRR